MSAVAIVCRIVTRILAQEEPDLHGRAKASEKQEHYQIRPRIGKILLNSSSQHYYASKHKSAFDDKDAATSAAGTT